MRLNIRLIILKRWIMANGRYDYDDEEQAVRVPKKADVILKRQQEMAVKQNETITAVNASNTRLDEVLA